MSWRSLGALRLNPSSIHVSLTERSNQDEAARFSLVRPSCIHRHEENVLWLVSVCIAVTKAPLQQLFWCGQKAVPGTV